jgi:hypothetical protein
MISSYTITNQTVDTDVTLAFNINKIKTGCTVTHAEGTPTFSLNKPGYYFISFDASAAGTAAGDVVVQMYENGVPVADAITTMNSTAATDIGNLSFTTIVQVRPSCCAINNESKLTFVNTGVEAVFSNVNLVITKLC